MVTIWNLDQAFKKKYKGPHFCSTVNDKLISELEVLQENSDKEDKSHISHTPIALHFLVFLHSPPPLAH